MVRLRVQGETDHVADIGGVGKFLSAIAAHPLPFGDSRAVGAIFFIDPTLTQIDPYSEITYFFIGGTTPITYLIHIKFIGCTNVLNGRFSQPSLYGHSNMDHFIFHFESQSVGAPISLTDESDQFEGGNGPDYMHGLSGSDTISGGNGNDELWGDAGSDTLDGGRGDDLLYGGQGHDHLSGGQGNDELFGNEGSDDLDGGSGDDLISGGTGSDRLNGGSGNDLLEGGSGADYFVFEGHFGNDTIVDFGNSPGDRIDLSALGLTSIDQIDITDTDVGAVITLMGGSITLIDVSSADLGADVFVLI